ncbi:MAG: HEAT repeat domain-containing protein [Deltaproteobacteria bacterium]|nr:HEAT repeat domain-containing protein [Deltaproteobacteria bacterium]MBW2384520.1 HEAT repeat domain-containing protein [Deltaproteobacteria bacterium]MBW2695337.1 HEAT repeat domain-containing protein [Deltaproteobacteria bacterium]
MSTEVADRERQAILHDLANPDEEMRRLAVERLLALSIDEALPHLLEGLGDSSWRVRKAVVERLVSCGEHEGVGNALIGALADGENSGRRNSAFEALVGIGNAMAPKLLVSLQSDDVDVRKLVLDVLAGIGDPECNEAVIGMLEDQDPNVRAAAADALGVFGDEAAGRAMHTVAVNAKEDSLVRLSALRALAPIEHTLCVEDLSPVLDDSLLRPAAYTLLGQVGDDASVICLLKGITLSSRASRESAMAALLRILSKADGGHIDRLVENIRDTARANERLVTETVERLPDADLATRMTLIQFLGLTEDPVCVVPILEAGSDEAIAEVAHATLEGLGQVTVAALETSWNRLPMDLRSDACQLMGRIGGDKAACLLLASLDDVDSGLRAHAARALGDLHCMEALGSLVRRLESAALDDEPESEEEVAAFIDALVALAPPGATESEEAQQVIQMLASRLEGSGEDVRLAIASVLGRIGRIEDEELVAGLLRDASARVRRAAVEALARLEPGAASEPLRLALADESPLVRIAAAGALGHSENPAVIADLQRLIHDEDTRVSAAAVRSIGAHCRRDNVGADEAVELIRHALGCDGMVSLAAVESLCMIGGHSAASAALAVLDRNEPEIVQSAVVCIGAHGEEETVSELVSLVSHESWSVRAEAIQTLAERGIRRAVPPILRRLETEQDSFVRDAILRALKQLED